MARVKKPKPTLESIVWVTPEQKLLRFLLTECSTPFTPRVLSSRLKGVRGLGGSEGIQRILNDLAEIGLIAWIDNNRAVTVQNEKETVQHLKSMSAVCDLEGLSQLLEPISTRGILFGSRSSGRSRSDSNYNLFVASDKATEVTDICQRHPLGKKIEVIVRTEDEYNQLDQKDNELHNALKSGIILWGSSWSAW